MLAGQRIVQRVGRLGSPRGDLVPAVFAAGIALRVAFLVLYRPAFLGDSDAGSYIFAAHHGVFSNVYDPAGYPLFLRVVHAVWPHLSFLILVQHALGVATAWLLYTTVRRVTDSVLLGLVPAAVVLFDGYALWVEHTPITETVFAFLAAGVLCLSLRAAKGSLVTAAAVGLLIGVAGIVRPVGFVLLPIVGLWLLWVRAGGAGRRVVAVSAVLLPACIVGGVYVLVQRSETGFTGLTRDSGRVLYARAAGFADCRRFNPPAGTAQLCETTPAAQRGSFNQYLTGYPDGAGSVTEAQRVISPAWRVFGPPPAGNSKLLSFGVTAIINQPADYITAVAKDFHYYWADDHRAFIAAAGRVNPGVDQIVAGYYRTGVGVAAPGLGLLRWYGEHIEVTGILMIILLLGPLAGLVLAEGEARRAAALFAGAGWLLPLVADAAASVDPRFALPAYGPLAAAAAIGFGAPRFRRVMRRVASAGRRQPAARHG